MGNGSLLSLKWMRKVQNEELHEFDLWEYVKKMKKYRK